MYHLCDSAPDDFRLGETLSSAQLSAAQLSCKSPAIRCQSRRGVRHCFYITCELNGARDSASSATSASTLDAAPRAARIIGPLKIHPADKKTTGRFADDSRA